MLLPDWANLDLEREARTGVSEVVFGQGKTPEQVRLIATALLEKHGRVLVTRSSAEQAQACSELGGVYAEASRVLRIGEPYAPVGLNVLVVSAGTSDLPVAEEAALCCAWFGCATKTFHDLGVAGLHRTLRRLDDLRQADVLIVVAGMEGALTSVVGGLVSTPVIAVPTSIGYGTHMNGMVALLAMLNSCASGVTVVNVDNGFGAAMAARRMAQTFRAARERCE
jgi:pyridinium-3,5-biscarboxylic acid mononucleotide synthase